MAHSTVRDRSLFITGGGGWRVLGGGHLIFRRTEGGSVVIESPKGGITENFGKIQGGTTQIYLDNAKHEGDHDSYQ